VGLQSDKFKKVCFAYYLASSGGVERVFLNRGEALLRRYPNLEVELYFHNDMGGVQLIERYVKARKLGDRLRVTQRLKSSLYDVIFVVDSPQLLADNPSVETKMIMECHTAYEDARKYLVEWQNRIRKLVVPSSGFIPVVERECPALRGKVKVLRNFVPNLPALDRPLSLPAWRAPLFLYFSRFDELKNFSEFVAGISSARQYSRDEPLGLACGQILPFYPPQAVIDNHAVRGSVIVLPPVPFENSHILMQMVRQKKGVFVSCSKGESFGLSAAEAMIAGLPVILSDIPAHAALVSHRKKFLYSLGDVRQLALRMAGAIDHYDELAVECAELSREFSEETFLSDWERLFA
jgi:glycosyltransferase involved in cell wall biosynthesis